MTIMHADTVTILGIVAIVGVLVALWAEGRREL